MKVVVSSMKMNVIWIMNLSCPLYPKLCRYSLLLPVMMKKRRIGD